LGWKADAITEDVSASMMLAFTEELPISYPSNNIIFYLSTISKFCDFPIGGNEHLISSRKGIKVRNKRIFAKRELEGDGRKGCF
jgi:hypothetical protein